MATKTLTDDEQKQGMSNAAGTTLDGAGTGGGSQTGTNWTNLSQYLDNNKGAGAGIADGITKDTQANVDKVDGHGGTVDTWETDAKKQVDQNTRQDQYSGTIKNGTSKDVAGIDQGAYGAWKALGNYTGAKDAAGTNGYGDAYKAVNNTKDQIKNLGSYDGQKAALQNTYGKSGSYGTGFQNLDAFALNGDQSGQKKLQDFQTNNANFGQKLDTATSGVNSYIGGAGDRGKAVLDNTNQVINDRSKGYGNAAQTALAADDGGYQAKADAVKQKFNNAGVDYISHAGISGAPISLQDQYVNTVKGDASAYMSDEDRAAANNLAGIDEDPNSNAAVTPGSQTTTNVNWDALQAYLSANAPKTPVTATETPVVGKATDQGKQYRY